MLNKTLRQVSSKLIQSPYPIAKFSSGINEFYVPNKAEKVAFNPKSNKAKGYKPEKYKQGKWGLDQIMKSTEEHVIYTWGATDPARKGSIPIERGEGIYLYDYSGNKYIDMTSQAINNNLGYGIPKPILDAITYQLQNLHHVYGGLTITEPKAKLAEILNDLTPPEITGFIFPLTGSDANEVAIRTARSFTKKNKILTRYKSYHGGSSGALNATGDFRRFFAEAGISGFVKFYDFQAMQFKWGTTQEESIGNYLAYLEETILNENPNTIAAIMVEAITGSAGVLVNPPEIIQGIRALCDKYNILMIIDEVMSGVGRSGEMFAFQTYEGVIPDIFTCAKGLSGSYLPLSAAGFRKEIQDHFRTNPIGWGTTFQAHPVSCIAGFETMKYMVEHDVVGHVQKMSKVLEGHMEKLLKKHNCLRQGRIRGLFAAFDLVGKDGQLIQRMFQDPNPPVIGEFKKKLLQNGIFAWVRPPIMHLAPPLIITEEELNDAISRIDDALKVLDH